MDRKNEFTKWIKTVENAISSDVPLQEKAECTCNKWDCTACHPDDDGALAESQIINEKSVLNKHLAKEVGGQKLIQLLHSKHKLDHEAELQPVPYNKNVLWTQFKLNPDDFVIVSAEHGVAAIKPSKANFDFRVKQYAKRGKVYRPEVDRTLKYQVIAFTDEGEYLPPSLFQAPADPDKEDKADSFQSDDPTIIRTRMGRIHRPDPTEPYNVFGLLAEKIGTLKTAWVSGFWGIRGEKGEEQEREPAVGSVPNAKIAARQEIGQTAGAEQRGVKLNRGGSMSDRPAHQKPASSKNEMFTAEEKHGMIQDIMSMQEAGLSKASTEYDENSLVRMSDPDLNKAYGVVMGKLAEDELTDPAEVADVPAQTGGSIGSVGSGDAAGPVMTSSKPTGNPQFSAGTAPTLPEGITGRTQMNESKSLNEAFMEIPVLNRKQAQPEVTEAAEAHSYHILDTDLGNSFYVGVDGNTDMESALEVYLDDIHATGEYSPAVVRYTDYDRPAEDTTEVTYTIRDKATGEELPYQGFSSTDIAKFDEYAFSAAEQEAEASRDVYESADTQVLEWMKRFSKLGNR